MNPLANGAPNAALSDLRDIHLPAPVSWWPPAPGWWLLFALAASILFGVFIWNFLRRRNRWRRSALAELARLREQHASRPDAAGNVVAELSTLLRRVVLSRFPRDEVAGLTGEAWLAFLDRSLGDTRPFQSDGELLKLGPYRSSAVINAEALTALFATSERWIRALPGGAGK